MLRLPVAGLAVIVLAAGCALITQEDERLRIEQVEAAVAPMARVALDTGQLDTATRLYNRLLDVDPQSLAGHMGLGDVALANGDSDGAADWYFAAIVLARTPEQYHEAVLAHGRAALDAGRLEEARESFLKLTEPGESVSTEFAAWGHNGAGLTLLLEGDLVGAIAYMQRAVRQAPREPTFRENLQRALTMQRGESGRVTPEDDDALAPEPSGREAPAPEPVPILVPDTKDAPADTPEAVSDPTDEPSAAAAAQAEAALDDAASAASTLSDPPAEAQPMVEEDAESSGEAPEPPVEEDAAPLDEDAAAPPEEDTPSSTPDATAGALIVTANGQRYLQLGAYRSRYAAETVVKYFSTLMDEPIFIATEPIDGEPMHRVRAGPLESEASMHRLLEVMEATNQRVR